MRTKVKLKPLISILLLIFSLSINSTFSSYDSITDSGKKIEQFAVAIEDFLNGHGSYTRSDLPVTNENIASTQEYPLTELLKYRIESLSRSAKVIALYRAEVLKSFMSYKETAAINTTTYKTLSIIKVLLEFNSPYSIADMTPTIDKVKSIPGYCELSYTDSMSHLIVTPEDKQAIDKLNEVINNFNTYIVGNSDGGLGLEKNKRMALFEYVAKNSDAIAINEANLTMQYDLLQTLSSKFIQNKSYKLLLELVVGNQLSMELDSVSDKLLFACKIHNDMKFDSIINNELPETFEKVFDRLLEVKKITLKLLMLMPIFLAKNIYNKEC
jgi:hypothetical protein